MRVTHTALVLLLACALSEFAAAEWAADVGALRGEWLERSVSVHFTDTDASTVLAGLGKVTGVKFVVDPAVRALVSVDLSDKPVRQVLAFVGEQAKVRYDQQRDVIHVRRNVVRDRE